MYITAATLDDLMHGVLDRLLKSQNRVKPTRGEATELTGVLLKLRNPRARLSRTEKKGTIFSCLGELLWYLAKTNDLKFIEYYLAEYGKYSDDGRTIFGGYGPRLFNMRRTNQVKNVLSLLSRNGASRRAVIQLFDAGDLTKDRKDIPCTCALQFLIRQGRLHMFSTMRSNDAFVGLPHDIFAFTMIQEIFARALTVEVGTYKHAVGSLHLYAKNIAGAKQYLDEGWQSTTEMPPMPFGNPWGKLSTVLGAEALLRGGGCVDIRELALEPYWADLVRLLQIYRFSKLGDAAGIVRIKRRMSSSVYNTYIDRRQRRAARETNPQRSLFPNT